MDQDSAHMVAASKVPMLKPVSIKIWIEDRMNNYTDDRLCTMGSHREWCNLAKNNNCGSFSPEWNTHAVVWRNKVDLDTMSMDDLYNNLKAEEGPNYALMAFSSLSPNSEFVNKPVVENCKAMSIEKYLREIPNDLQEPMRNWNSGCLRHMIGNMSYLIDYEEIDGGYVAFGGNPKGGKITGKATKDETSGILKSFITGIENRIDHKVKVIRCDNGTEFKNREMNQFCEMKGILRQFSVARTPQQNGVAERRNMTLIEAARTMLADSKLPTTFWAEAVNTACYVQNRVIEDPDFPDRVYKVEKALYGLHQAPRAWYETLSTYLLDNGFQRGKIDKTLFIKRYKGDMTAGPSSYVKEIILVQQRRRQCIAFE
ncbi:ribonuclease H-like domain-containing protein [Tanacetum coccineum]